MANLETLELTINANAEGASRGIDSLITSLGSLASALTKPLGLLQDLNLQLKDLKKYSTSINFANIGKAISSKSGAKAIEKTVSDADQKWKSAMEQGAKIAREWAERTAPAEIAKSQDSNKTFWQLNPALEQQREAQRQLILMEREAKERYLRDFEDTKQRLIAEGKFAGSVSSTANAMKDVATEAKGATQAVREYKAETEKAVAPAKDAAKVNDLEAAKMAKKQAQIEKLNAETAKLNEQTAKIKEATEKGIGGMDKPIKRVTSLAGRLLSSIGRIFKTMLIRTAIRTLLKGAKEGLDNYYTYSQNIGGAFASAMDSINSKWGQIKNQIGAGLGTALASFLPILSAIASAATVALNAITALFSLLGGKSTYSVAKATDSVKDYGKAVSGAGKATQDWLASFDELNVMAQKTGGGGGGAKAVADDITSMFEEVALPNWMIEWLPVIQAILAGTLGAIVLPKIFDWIKKIVTLFGGSDALNLIDILKRMFKLKDTDFDKPLDGLDKVLKNVEKINEKNDNLVDFPDIGKEITQMGLYASAAAAASAAIEALKDKVVALKGALEGINALSTILQLLTSLLGSLVGGSIKFSVDDKAFKEWKKDFEKWKEENSGVEIKLKNGDALIAQILSINTWINHKSVKDIELNVAHLDAIVYAISSINTWTNQRSMKVIEFRMDNITALTNAMTGLGNWINSRSTKIIALEFVDNGMIYGGLVEWIAKEDTKVINVEFRGSGNPSGGDSPDGGGLKFDVDEFAEIMSWNTNDIINKIFGREILPSEGIIPWVWKKIVGGEEKTEVDIGEILHVANTKAFKDEVEKELKNSINGALGVQNLKRLKDKFPTMEANDIFTIVGVDKLTSEETGLLITSMVQAFGSYSAIASIRRAIPNISIDALLYFIDQDKLTKREQDELVDTLTNAFGSSGIKAIKDRFPNIKAEEIVKVIKWDELENTQKTEFLAAISNAFGSEDAIKAAKDAGINIGDLVEEGMQSKDENIRTAAVSWHDIINEEVEKDPPVVMAELGKDVATDMATAVKDTIEAVSASVTDIDTKFKEGYPDNLKTAIEGVSATIDAATSVSDASKKAIKDSIEALKPTVSVTAELKGMTDFANKIANGIKDAVDGIKVDVKDDKGNKAGSVELVAAASGGLFNSGDIFIANENGTGEMVGRFGNQTGVANQREIVAGIQKGVSDANQEQNALLMEQNSLLRSILVKESNVRLVASSALGRTVKQSMDMYSMATGV